MPQDFACKWLLIMGFIGKLITRGQSSSIPLIPPQSPVCTPFVTDRVLKEFGAFEFSSPGYTTKQYPNHTDCVRVLAAPAANKIISLDFRDDFHIEPSVGCEYDYLEIRDGPYGFSPKFGNGKSRFCGKEFPMDGAKIVSSGQFLWLRFRSDSSIQHAGFKAVYEYQSFMKTYPPQELTCRTPVSIEYSKTIDQNSFPAGYLAEQKQNKKSLDCTFDISSKEGTQILVHFDKLNFTRDNHCGKASVEVYDGYSLSDRPPGLRQVFCKASDEKITSSFNRVIIRTKAKEHSLMPTLKITITAMSLAPCNKNSEYLCESGNEEEPPKFCIRKSLKCDKKINCPQLDDEKCTPGIKPGELFKNLHPTQDGKKTSGKGEGQNKKKDESVPYHYIILGIIGAVLCFFILICMFITVRQRRAETRNRRREELLRRSSTDDQRYLPQQPAAAQQQSPHSIRRDMHTPSSLEGNRLMDMNQRPGPPDSSSLGRLTKQNGAVMMGANPAPKGATHTSPNTAAIAATSSSAYYDPRAVHSTRVGKYLAVPNPPAHPDDEELCLGISPVEQVGQARIAYEDTPPSPPQHACEGGCGAGGRGSPVAGPSGARCKVHGEVYHRDAARLAAHQPIIHRSDSAPSKAFFRVGSVTPPPGPSRMGAATPPSYRQHGASVPQHQHYEGRHYSGEQPQYYTSSGRGQRDPYYHRHTAEDPMVSSVHRPRSQPYAPAPAYSLHNLPVAARDEDEDSAPCTCRHHEPPAPHYPPRDREPPSSVVRQASLGTPRSLRRKIYET